jgi:transglutaminase-like putative cysteine protease
MRYDIRHVTVYDWGSPIPFADCRLRLTPIERRRQRVLVSRLEVDPPADGLVDELDFFGNHITRVAFRAPHRRLRLCSTATVVVEPAPALVPDTSPPWEDVRARAALSRSLDPTDPVQFLFPSRHVVITPPVSAWAAECFPPGRSILAGTLAMTERIWEEFDYAPGTTEIATPLAEVFEEKRGVCQDFAHLMIAALRGLGLPAAYVGGYLRTLPPEGQPRLEGADAMHAWVEVWCGPVIGWLGFDPTNGIVASDEHIVVAVGRDYADVSPITGVLLSTGHQGMSVAVDVIESPEPPRPPAPGTRQEAPAATSGPASQSQSQTQSQTPTQDRRD